MKENEIWDFESWDIFNTDKICLPLNIELWDLSKTIDMGQMFREAQSFNEEEYFTFPNKIKEDMRNKI